MESKKEAEFVTLDKLCAEVTESLYGLLEAWHLTMIVNYPPPTPEENEERDKQISKSKMRFTSAITELTSILLIPMDIEPKQKTNKFKIIFERQTAGGFPTDPQELIIEAESIAEATEKLELQYPRTLSSRNNILSITICE